MPAPSPSTLVTVLAALFAAGALLSAAVVAVREAAFLVNFPVEGE